MSWPAYLTPQLAQGFAGVTHKLLQADQWPSCELQIVVGHTTHVAVERLS